MAVIRIITRANSKTRLPRGPIEPGRIFWRESIPPGFVAPRGGTWCLPKSVAPGAAFFARRARRPGPHLGPRARLASLRAPARCRPCWALASASARVRRSSSPSGSASAWSFWRSPFARPGRSTTRPWPRLGGRWRPRTSARARPSRARTRSRRPWPRPRGSSARAPPSPPRRRPRSPPPSPRPSPRPAAAAAAIPLATARSTCADQQETGNMMVYRCSVPPACSHS